MSSIARSIRPLFFITGFFIIGLSSCNKDEVKPNPNTIKDFDGNEYAIVQIGNQVWMKENLKTTHFNDGTTIAHLEENALWLTAETAAYSWFNNDTENKEAYGALYNDAAAKSGNICPAGWRVPDNLDWFRLQSYANELEGSAAGNMREQGDHFWKIVSGSYAGTDRTGFSARGGGIRDIDGNFYDLKAAGAWWVSEENYHARNWGKYITIYQSSLFSIISDEQIGFSIRCIKAD